MKVVYVKTALEKLRMISRGAVLLDKQIDYVEVTQQELDAVLRELRIPPKSRSIDGSTEILRVFGVELRVAL